MLRLFHDEDAEVFLNGIPISRKDLLKPGRNVIVVRFYQLTDGQFFDFRLIAEMGN